MYSPLTGDYIGRGSIGLGLDGRQPRGVQAPASGLVLFDNAPIVHNTGYLQTGLRSPGWIGNVQPWQSLRNHINPYQNIGQGLGLTQGWQNSPDVWDVSKWIGAKYIQFPFDVYYYGATDIYFNSQHPGSQIIPDTHPTPFTQFNPFQGAGHQGGTSAMFVPAGTWITLYDAGASILFSEYDYEIDLKMAKREGEAKGMYLWAKNHWY